MPTRGPIALVGSGEYLPVMTEIEGRLIEGRPGRYIQLATAAAPEGVKSLAHWHRLGREQAERLGVEQVVVPVVDRVSADDEALAGLVAGAGLVYLSGGNPPYLAKTLHGTAVWTAIEAAWRGGAALAGCSAGAMALCGEVPEIRRPFTGPVEGLGAVPGLTVLPHFDRFARRLPDYVLRRLTTRTDGVLAVGVDEDTALVSGLRDDPGEWEVLGRQSVWLLRPDGREEHPAGSVVRLPAPV
ncbi:MAG TPA: Type 1 glutamine amidotransferase-like domain-containing protein [Actinomycetes bacterium]|nr:Type 1 glutamine amidotransferase-like domain-containing protein [Actinomycetes bacterium]